mmetsp:Transcript_116880/g.294028  ORF Transcript_116880/g.294028 Transcript_116880/m.294028 type:complete len:273 (-) Transcript_116880:86-904(-)
MAPAEAMVVANCTLTPQLCATNISYTHQSLEYRSSSEFGTTTMRPRYCGMRKSRQPITTEQSNMNALQPVLTEQNVSYSGSWLQSSAALSQFIAPLCVHARPVMRKGIHIAMMPPKTHQHSMEVVAKYWKRNPSSLHLKAMQSKTQKKGLSLASEPNCSAMLGPEPSSFWKIENAQTNSTSSSLTVRSKASRNSSAGSFHECETMISTCGTRLDMLVDERPDRGSARPCRVLLLTLLDELPYLARRDPPMLRIQFPPSAAGDNALRQGAAGG